MKNNIIVKNSLYVTSIMAIIILFITILFWNRMPMTQRLIGFYYFLIAAHEWEEMKFPGGCIEMVISFTYMPVKDMTIPKFCLFLVTVYMLLVPYCIPGVHWLVIGPLVLGIIEPVVHVIVGKANPKTSIYSPGLVTSVLFMVPIDVFTIYYITMRESFAWYHWLIAAIFLLIPLFGVQRFIVVRLLKMSYSEFVKNAKNSILGKNDKF